jgi:hypothetical protein
MNTSSELRNLTDEEMDAVAGGISKNRIEAEFAAGMSKPANPWAGWMASYFGIY